MSTNWWLRVRSHPHAQRALGLTVLFALAVTGAWFTRLIMDDPLVLWPGVALSALACAALLRRRTHPLPVLAATALCVMAESALNYLLTPLLMGPLLVAQYSTSLLTSRRTAWKSALVTAVATAVIGLFSDTFPHPLFLTSLNPAAWILVAAAVGGYVRVRREYAAARTEHAVHEREEEARRRVIQERIRIARELHDVVAHHLALANAQAGTAAHLARSNPEQAFEIVARLPETTAAALRELKATVGLLRQDTDDEETAPAPGLAQLPDLVATCAEAGLDVDVTVEGEPKQLTPGLDLTSYRVVQEALTNVTKHAATRTARVRLSYTPHHLTLTIDNDTSDPSASHSPAEPEPHRGFGLLGMHERALSVGGTFRAGPRPEGGFEVVCVLPLDNFHESENDS
ncbi:sensor histidine kinase [Streptomyces sp. 8P21H-1]|uniref:sensor histidine kinase n=1 Tax=Streptomyces sp. 8P21H-1 TaxID=2737048 RepID=UPI00156DB8B6|nr:sensor histidine kinase [Streptomyces sp. 8P21H-1]NSL43358.1 sensor histidine kinase [Streptomyces sp. 8P21H-1]